MLRKYCLAMAMACLTLSGFIVNAQSKKVGRKSPQQWNIVVFIADDLGVKDIEPYGNKVVRTPNLSRLAGESLLFRQAFASSPTCAPSRSSILTGLMPYRHGGHGNHAAVREQTRSIVHYMQPLNYRVAIAGKLHVGPEEAFPLERVEGTNLPEPGFEKNPGLHYDLEMGPVDKWLAAQTGKQPFCLFVADHSPHVIWPEKPEYDPAQVDIPAKHIDTRETRVARSRYYTDISKMDRNLGLLLQSLERHGLSENTIVLFTADQGPQWPFAKWSLYDDGVQVPLLVRWPGVVKKGTSTDALVSLTDLVPTFVELAGGKAPEEIDGRSFLPVLKGGRDQHREEVFATHTGDGMMNRSPARMLRNQRFKYILNIAPDIKYTTHMDRATDHDGGREYWPSWLQASFTDPGAANILWRYHNRPPEELYDLEKDPHETRNLAADPAYAKELNEFRTKMAEWRRTQGDDATGPEEIRPAPAGNKGKKPLVRYVF